MGQAGRSPRKRKTLEWLSEAAEIAMCHEDATKKMRRARRGLE